MRPHTKSVLVPSGLLKALETLTLSLSLCLFGCVASAEEDSAHLQARKKTAPYYQDAQICRSRSKADPLPDGADPAITIDPSKYLTCINQMGYHQEPKTDPLLVALQRCNDQKTRSVTASGEVTSRAPSQAQVRACLSARGFPSAGTPPNPNSPVASIQSSTSHNAGSRAGIPPTPSSTRGASPASLTPDESGVETVIIPPRQR